jgi:DNA primase
VSDVEEVKARLDIVEIVGEAVQLQRSGRNHKARCPFHTEKTPSFYVFPDRQTWHCFGACSTGGDVLNYVMKRDGLEFPEALRLLAERAGVTLSSRARPQEDEARKRLLSANEAAAVFFHQALMHAPEGAHAREYLAERGVDAEAMEAFQLGYSPDAWEALKSHLAERGYSDAELLAAGLVVESDRGGYDRFRGRLMFPIRDDRARLAGFGARALETDTNPKYINTPQSPIFDKGGLLYALDRAKDHIRRQGSVIIVEGYMDVIAAHQHGIGNVVASMGTALTERQVGLLKRYTHNVTLCLDADAAGSEATLRGLQVAGEALDKTTVPVPTWRGIIRHQETLAADIRVISLPDGLDPDEAIRSRRERWDELVEQAKPVLDYLFDAVAGRLDLTQPRERGRAVEELLPLVGAVTQPVVRAHYLQRLARLAQVDETTLRQALRPGGSTRRQQAQPEAASPAAPALHDKREEHLLALLLHYPQLRAEGQRLSPEAFDLQENRALFTAWRDAPNVESMRSALPEELLPHVDRITERTVPALDGSDLFEAFTDCVRRLELRRLSQAKQASTAVLLERTEREADTTLVEVARSIWEQGEAGDSGGVAGQPEQEAAVALVRDMELGRRIHQPRSEQGSETQRPVGGEQP